MNSEIEKVNKSEDKKQKKAQQIDAKVRTNIILKESTIENPKRYTETSSKKFQSLLTTLPRPKCLPSFYQRNSRVY